MRRPVQLLALLVLVPALGVGTASASAAKPAAKPRVTKAVGLSASVESCRPAKDAAGGRAVFVGSMPQIPGATRMEMRFELLQASGATDPAVADGFVKLAVPKWSQWLKSQPDRAGFVYRKKVVGLVGPGVYRALVHFRWRDAEGKVVRTTARRSAGCAQPDLRPNLVPSSVTAEPTGTDTADYRVVVRNTGRSSAGPFSTALSTPGSGPVSELVDGLDPKERAIVLLEGPRCAPGTTIDLTVDPAGAIDEADETDNAITVACPLPVSRR